MKKRDEVISTDDALSRIDSYNLKQGQSMKCRDILEPEETPSDITAENTFVDVLDEVLGVNWEQSMPEWLTLVNTKPKLVYPCVVYTWEWE